ncbi:MAG: hypothetical protein AAGE84_26750 [Cyanobacteria bacterium P01_G01_bin.39]
MRGQEVKLFLVPYGFALDLQYLQYLNPRTHLAIAVQSIPICGAF